MRLATPGAIARRASCALPVHEARNRTSPSPPDAVAVVTGPTPRMVLRASRAPLEACPRRTGPRRLVSAAMLAATPITLLSYVPRARQGWSPQPTRLSVRSAPSAMLRRQAPAGVKPARLGEPAVVRTVHVDPVSPGTRRHMTSLHVSHVLGLSMQMHRQISVICARQERSPSPLFGPRVLAVCSANTVRRAHTRKTARCARWAGNRMPILLRPLALNVCRGMLPQGRSACGALRTLRLNAATMVLAGSPAPSVCAPRVSCQRHQMGRQDRRISTRHH